MRISRDQVRDIVPMTPFQEGVLYHDLRDREEGRVDRGSYVQRLAFTIDGPFEPAAFERAWRILIERHDVLRSVFRVAGTPRPVRVALKSWDFRLEVEDLSALPPAERIAAAEARVAREDERPLPPDDSPPTRVVCLILSADEHRMIWSFHHILMDGWCIRVVQDELTAAYAAVVAGRTPVLPPAVPFADVVRKMEAARHPDDLDHWAGLLAGYETVSTTPATRPSPLSGPVAPRSTGFRLGSGPSAALAAAARRSGTTLATVMTVLWGTFQAKLNDTRDIVFGAVASTRPPELADDVSFVGPCLTTLPFRVKFTVDDDFIALATRAGAEALDRMERVQCPPADIQARVSPRGRLFNHYLAFENYPLEERHRGPAQELVPGTVIRDTRTGATDHYDFHVLIFPGPDVQVEFAFDARACDPDDVADLARRFTLWATRVAAAPDTRLDDLSVLTDVERTRILDDWSRGRQAPDIAGGVAETRRRVVEAWGDRPALRLGATTITHRELQRRVDALARRLHHDRGLRPGDVAAVFARAGEPMIRAVLACLTLGVAFVPLDPAAPALRLAHITANSGAAIILGDGDVPSFDGPPFLRVEETPFGDETRSLPTVGADATAYIIYTSGTTGEPKGVRVGARSLLNYVGWLRRDLGFDETARTMLSTSPAFDLGFTAVFGALLNGGCLSPLAEEERRDPDRVIECLVDHRLTHVKTTPSQLSMMLNAPSAERLREAADLRLMMLGGEAQNFVDLRRIRALLPGLRLLNHYGPTEATVGCVAGPLDPLIEVDDPPQRIGRPIAGARVLPCDLTGRPTPPGVPGELWVGGLSPALGYVDETGPDAARFVAAERFDGGRMYRTGDRAMWDREGNIVFLGRRDDQVKIRGRRATLAGIEAAVRDLPGVRDAAVVVTAGGDAIAHIILESGAEPSPTTMREQLRERLPEPLIPARFVPVSRFPTTANGKLDRAALAAHPLAALAAKPRDDGARGSATEEALRAVFREVLFLETVGLDDDFFQLGGHSVKAVTAVARVRSRLKRPIAVRDLFDHPTVRDLARRIDEGERATASGLIRLREASDDAPVALFLPPVFGTSTVYMEMTRAFSRDVACWGAQCPGFDRDEPFAVDIDALADGFAREARALRGSGPLRLVGWSMGARLAIEVARRLEGERETRLVLIDAAPSSVEEDPVEPRFESLEELRRDPRWTRILDALRAGMDHRDLERVERLALRNRRSLLAHRSTARLSGDITCVEATDNHPGPAGMAGFAAITDGSFTLHRTAGDHYTMFQPPHFQTTTRLVEAALRL